MSRKPAIGERSAASGYYAQYLVGASLVLDALDSGDLEWIKIADPNIGRVDDLQIATTSRVDAFQVKWEQYPGAISFNDLSKENNSAPSLFTQLVDGWQRLKKLYPSRRVVVHLLTNQHPSPSTKGRMPNIVSPPKPYHFAAFIEQAWKPTQRNGKIKFDDSWEPVWKAIQTLVELPFDEFNEFVRDCSLDFQTHLPKKTEEIVEIADFLFETAASPERLVELSRSELINSLGWKQRYSPWNTHEFPEPKYTYCPIRSTVKKLISKLDELKGGYIGVFGSPGSGKSTLLTQTLRTLPVILIRYYAYVPESQDPSAIRGEALSYLHDVTFKLSQVGFSGKWSRDPLDRIGLVNLFNQQIRELGKNYQSTGEKTVLLIDGLDHIDREQHPERSLLCDLPLPQEVPEGVYIVLGSQTDSLSDLPPRVLRELKHETRRVEMSRFSPTDVRTIASIAVPDLSEKENHKIFEISNGHPLALIYLLKGIQHISDPNIRFEELEESQQYQGDIYDQYWSHWPIIENDDDLRFALGLLCRTRGAISMEWVASWAEPALMRKIEKLFLTFFERDSQNSWSFFHNSFRLFLISQTGKPLPGQTAEQQNQLFHRELANLYKNARTPWCWETLYHYNFAKDHHSVIALATWEWFIEQLDSLRPLDAIQTDIRLAIKSAGFCQDTVSLTRLTLIGAAIEQRSWVLDDRPIPELLLQCGKISLAADHIRDGNRLRVSEEQALGLCPDLKRAGLEREAHRIFELAEPLEILSGKTIPDDHTRPQNLWDLLGAWVQSAVVFRKAEEIVNTIRRIRIAPGFNETDDFETFSLRLQNWLIFQGALACCDWGDWENWQIYFDALDPERDWTQRLLTLLRSAERGYDEEEFNHFQTLLPELISNYPPDYLASRLDKNHWAVEASVSFAELLIDVDENFQDAHRYIDHLEPILIFDSDLGYNHKPLQSNLRFRIARLQYLLGDSQTPSEKVSVAEAITEFPNHLDEEEKENYRYIAYATYTAARFWAWGKAGNRLSAVSFLQEIQWIIDLFGSSWAKLQNRHRLGLGLETRTDIFEFVILAAKQHGLEVLNALKDEIETRWNEPKESGSWWSGFQRNLIVSFAKSGIEDAWVSNSLLRIEPIMLYGLDNYSKADECEAQAKAWLTINEVSNALTEIKRMTHAARGIRGEDDYQLREWVKWLGKINKIEPDKQVERIQLMLKRIASVQDVASGVADASEEMLGIVFQWSPNTSVKLLKSMLENNYVNHHRCVTRILEEAININEPPLDEVLQVAANILIPFITSSEPELLEKLIILISQNKGNDVSIQIAQYLIDNICVDALKGSRKGWIQGVTDGLQKIGIPLNQVTIESALGKDEEDQNTSQIDRNLHLKNGKSFTPTDVLHLIKTNHDLENFLQNEDYEKNQFFDWVTVAEHLVPQLINVAQLNELENLLTPRLTRGYSYETYLSRLHLALSKRYIEIGNQSESLNHAQKALDLSTASGWDPYSDGGVRYEVIRHLRTITPYELKDFVFELYASDISERYYNPARLVVHLHQILETISEQVPILEIWSEIEQYLDDLFVSVDVHDEPSLENCLYDIDDLPNKDNSAAAVTNILYIYLAHPSYTIAQKAVSGLYELILAGSVTANMALHCALSGSELLAQRSLMVVDALSITDTVLIANYSDELEKLSVSANFTLRLMASSILARVNTIPLAVNRINKPLPAVYSLYLPDMAFYESDKEMRGDKSPIAIGDLAKKIRPFDIEVRNLAVETNLPEDNLLFRVSEYFESFLTDRIWLDNGEVLTEDQLRIFLDNIGLWTAHTKPHINPVLRALSYTIAELWDCGRLNSNHIRTLQIMLLNHDPEFIVSKPTIRPNNVVPLGDQNTDSFLYRIPKNWLDQAEDSIQHLCTQINDEEIVLGERTKLRYLYEKLPEEKRYSVISPREPARFWENLNIFNGHLPFYRSINSQFREYPYIQAPIEHIIVSNRGLSLETPGTGWIALNPVLGKKLGWRLIPNRWFQWVDKNGEITAKSIWWGDGIFDQFNRHVHEEIGEGWIVVVTQSGFEEIKNYFGKLNRGCVVWRRLGWLGIDGEKMAEQVTNIL